MAKNYDNFDIFEEPDFEESEEPQDNEENPSAEVNIKRDVFETDYGYYKVTRGKNSDARCVSNIILNATAKIVTDNDWYFVCEAIASNNETKKIILAREDFGSGQAMKNALSRHMYEYYGNSNDTTQILGILVDQNPPVKRGLSKHGIYKIDGIWHYVEGDQVICADGKSDAVVALGNKSGQQAISTILDQPDLTGIQRYHIADNMYRFNDSTITFPVLGFIGFCFLKPRIKSIGNSRNPILFIQGEPGTGKSDTIVNIINKMLSNETPLTNISDCTEFSSAVRANSTNMSPVAYDEWKTATVTKAQKRVMDQMILATYSQTPIQRGRGNGEIQQLAYTAPMVLAGEMTNDSPSLKHRTVELFYTYAKRTGKEDYYHRLIEMPLGALGKELLMHCLSLSDEQIQHEYEHQASLIDSDITNRFQDNAILFRMGLWLLIDYFQSNGIDTQNYDCGYDVIDAVILEMMNAANITNVDKTLQDFATLASLGRFTKGIDYDIKDNVLRVKIAGVYSKYEQWNRHGCGTSEVIGKHSFLQQVEDKPYYMGKKTTRIGVSGPSNAIHIDLSQVPEQVDIGYFREIAGIQPGESDEDLDMCA